MKPHDNEFNRLMREAFADTESAPRGGPDLTRRIMNRLGYMRCAPAVARRRRLMQFVMRTVVAMMIAFVLVGTYAKVQSGPSVRRPTGPTLPAALKQEVQQQRSRLERWLEAFPRIEPSQAPEAEDEFGEFSVEPGSDLDRSAMALVRWM